MAKRVAGGVFLTGAALVGAEAAETFAAPVAETIFVDSEADQATDVLELCFPDDGIFSPEADTHCPSDVSNVLDLPESMTEQEVIHADRGVLRQAVEDEVVAASESEEEAKNDIKRKMRLGGAALSVAGVLATYGGLKLMMAVGDRELERAGMKRRLTELIVKQKNDEGITQEEQVELYELNAFFHLPGNEQWQKWRKVFLEKRREAKDAHKTAKLERRAQKSKQSVSMGDNTTEVIPYEGPVGKPSASISNFIERLTGQYSPDERKQDKGIGVK